MIARLPHAVVERTGGLLLCGNGWEAYTDGMRVVFFWAIPSWIVGLALSSKFRPAVSFTGMMAAFVATLLLAHLFSFRELFTSLEGVGVLIAEAVAGLILTGAVTAPRRRRA